MGDDLRQTVSLDDIFLCLLNIFDCSKTPGKIWRNYAHILSHQETSVDRLFRVARARVPTRKSKRERSTSRERMLRRVPGRLVTALHGGNARSRDRSRTWMS